MIVGWCQNSLHVTRPKLKRNQMPIENKREEKYINSVSLCLQFQMRLTILLFQLFVRWKLNNLDWLSWIIKTILQQPENLANSQHISRYFTFKLLFGLFKTFWNIQLSLTLTQQHLTQIKSNSLCSLLYAHSSTQANGNKHNQ